MALLNGLFIENSNLKAIKIMVALILVGLTRSTMGCTYVPLSLCTEKDVYTHSPV